MFGIVWLQLVLSGVSGSLIVDGVQVATFQNTYPNRTGWLGLAVPYGVDQVLHIEGGGKQYVRGGPSEIYDGL